VLSTLQLESLNGSQKSNSNKHFDWFTQDAVKLSNKHFDWFTQDTVKL